jgi:hypothetical protein
MTVDGVCNATEDSILGSRWSTELRRSALRYFLSGLADEAASVGFFGGADGALPVFGVAQPF